MLLSAFGLALLFAALECQACTWGRSDHSNINFPQTGLLIQSGNRASCDGEVVEWTVCFNSIIAQQFSISLQVWRESGNSVLQRIGRNGQMLRGNGQLNSIQCQQVSIDAPNRIATRQGDYLGLFLPSNGFPIKIATSSSNSIYRSRDSLSLIRLNDITTFRLVNQELSISARIEPTNFTTMSSMSSTTETSTQDLSTTTNQLTTPTKKLSTKLSTTPLPEASNDPQSTTPTSLPTTATLFTTPRSEASTTGPQTIGNLTIAISTIAGADIPSNNNLNTIIIIIIAVSAAAVLLIVVLIIVIAAVKMKSSVKKAKQDAETHYDVPSNIPSSNRGNDTASALNNVKLDSTDKSDVLMSSNVSYDVPQAHIYSQIPYDYPMNVVHCKANLSYNLYDNPLNIPCQANLSYKSEF